MTDTSATGDDVAGMGANSGNTVRGQEDGTHPDLPYASADDTAEAAAADSTGQSGGADTTATGDDSAGLGDMDDVVPGAGATEPPD